MGLLEGVTTALRLQWLIGTARKARAGQPNGLGKHHWFAIL